MRNGSPNFKQAHPDARRLMDEDFYYSPIEESGPFGNDDGRDTFSGFQRWRPLHPEEDPLVFLREQLAAWGYPPYDLQEVDTAETTVYEGTEEQGITFVIGMDATINALAFAQLYYEGNIEAELCALAIISIRRQLHPELLELWDEEYQPIRKEQLLKMLGVLQRVG